MAIEVYSKRSFLFAHPFLGVIYLDVSQITPGEKCYQLQNKRGTLDTDAKGSLYFSIEILYSESHQEEDKLKISFILDINAPIYDTVETFTDFEMYPLIMEDFKNVKVINILDDTEFDVEFKKQNNNRYVMRYKISYIDKTCFCNFKCIDGPIKRYEGLMAFEPKDEKKTLFKYSVEMEFGGNLLLSKLFSYDYFYKKANALKKRTETEYDKSTNKTIYDW